MSIHRLPVLGASKVRRLKIETDGDFWKGCLKPKIRLVGRWLEQAGFTSGNHVQVTCVAPGVIELRSSDTVTVAGSTETDETSARVNAAAIRMTPCLAIPSHIRLLLYHYLFFINKY